MTVEAPDRKFQIGERPPALCEQCGSVQITPTAGSHTERLLAKLTARRQFLCKRCGWKRFRRWTDDDLERLKKYGAGGAVADPELRVLDHPPNRSKPIGDRQPSPQRISFDLDSLDFTASNSEAGASQRPGPWHERPSVRRRRRSGRLREVVVRCLLLAAAMLGIAMLITGMQ